MRAKLTPIRALLDHMADFKSMKSHLNQTEPLVLTKAILEPHVRFKLEDTSEPDSNIDDPWMAQANDPEVMQELTVEWGTRGNKANNQHPLCTSLMKQMLSI